MPSPTDSTSSEPLFQPLNVYDYRRFLCGQIGKEVRAWTRDGQTYAAILAAVDENSVILFHPKGPFTGTTTHRLTNIAVMPP